MMSKKLNVAVIFGGQSSEHEVSCISVQTIVKAMNPEKYDITLIGITKRAAGLKQIIFHLWQTAHGARAVKRLCFHRMQQKSVF